MNKKQLINYVKLIVKQMNKEIYDGDIKTCHIRITNFHGEIRSDIDVNN